MRACGRRATRRSRRPRRADTLRPIEIQDPDGRDRVIVGRVRTDESDRAAIRADARLRVADRAGRELTRPRDRTTGSKVDRVEVTEVAVALDRAADDDRRPPIDREVELFDDD